MFDTCSILDLLTITGSLGKSTSRGLLDLPTGIEFLGKSAPYVVAPPLGDSDMSYLPHYSLAYHLTQNKQVQMAPNSQIVLYLCPCTWQIHWICDDLSGRVQGTGSYLVSNLILPRWMRKSLKEKRFSSINWGQYRLERDQGSPVEDIRSCPVGVVTEYHISTSMDFLFSSFQNL